MKNILIPFSLTIAFILSYHTSNAQSFTDTIGKKSFYFPHINRDAIAILQSQLRQGAQKTTNTEVITSRFSHSGGQYDSISYSYSGGRGINVNTNPETYFDEYNPIDMVSHLPGINSRLLTILYDTAVYYSSSSGSSWNVVMVRNRNYDLNNNLIFERERNYDIAGVINRQTYISSSYNADNNLITSIHFWDTTIDLSGGYKDGTSLSANYLVGTNLRTNDTITVPVYNTNILFSTGYTYNSANQLLSSITLIYNPSTSSWDSGSIYAYSYDAIGRLTKIATNVFNNGQWTLIEKDTFGYAGTAQTYTFYQHDEDYNTFRSILKLNASQAPDSLFTFSLVNGNWMATGQGSYTYNANGNLTEHVYIGLNQTTIHRWHYSPVSSIAQNIASSPSNISIYPNPATTKLRFNIQDPGNYISVNIYNVDGKIFKRILSSPKNLEVNIEELPSGSYFVEIHTKTQTAVCKFSKI